MDISLENDSLPYRKPLKVVQNWHDVKQVIVDEGTIYAVYRLRFAVSGRSSDDLQTIQEESFGCRSKLYRFNSAAYADI